VPGTCTKSSLRRALPTAGPKPVIHGLDADQEGSANVADRPAAVAAPLVKLTVPKFANGSRWQSPAL
jgi:hypothetical protein